MPNGFSSGSKEDWARLEAPLITLDPELEAYARQHGMTLSKNYHAWPERTLEWQEGFSRKMQISLDDEHRMTWSFWLCAWEDRGKQRFWKKQSLKQAVPFQDIRENCAALLKQGRVLLSAWTAKDLELVP